MAAEGDEDAGSLKEAVSLSEAQTYLLGSLSHLSALPLKPPHSLLLPLSTHCSIFCFVISYPPNTQSSLPHLNTKPFPMATLNFTILSKTLTTPPLNNKHTISKPSSFINSSFCFNNNNKNHPFQSIKKPILTLVKAVDGEYSSRRSSSSEPRETIMLPGCDYNHWLIVMEFPKDPAPTREQMIDTYLNTLATVLGSMEEAKKNMYAFSTTTYTGFQCTVSEETSEKFKGLPGVLWVLPDSYIDVKNKDYGGDKYVNGEIIPCQYPTYQPKPRKQSKYESKRYVRQRDGPPPEQRRLKQEAASSESPST